MSPSQSAPVPDGFSALIAPSDPAVFLSDYLGKEFLAIPGQPDKVQDLLSWAVLNDILSYQAVAPHLRMSKEGAQLPAASFLKTRYAVSGSATQVPLATELVTQLRDGASLILNGIDALHRPIRALAEGLELATRSLVQVNMYASWRSSPGFDLHYDDHDVFIIQIEGPKHWKVFRPTDRFPIVAKSERNPERLALEPVFDGVLKPGDVLFIPRGWWHVVTPLDEPTMHLTAGLHPPTGLKLVEWALGGLKTKELLRMDVPRFDSQPREEYLKAIRDAVAESMADPELITKFLDHVDATAERRPLFALPWSATPKILPDSPDSIIIVLSPNGFRPKPDGAGDVKIAFAGKELTFGEATVPLFEYLSRQAAPSVADFCRCFEDRFQIGELREFLAELATHGAIVVSESK